LREGQELAFELDSGGQLKTLRFDRDSKSRVAIKVAGESITEDVQALPEEHRVEVAAGTITSSLYADGARAGLTSSAINEMANMFKYDIDFVEDVRDGDTFQVVYEEIWRDGRRVGTGDVIGATFTNRGKRYTAYTYNQDGRKEYFDETGRPLKKVLMRIPIEFARLSSTFGMRKHPVLGRMRAHKGVDYAARTGTPIMAAGDAKVAFVGWRNGYGRAVILDHGQGRSTLYGHMSAWGKEKVGQHVSQGSTIGYVGASGLATGPHLHYEFRINGNQVNPLTVTMPKPQPLSGMELVRFRAATAPVLAKLLMVEKNTRLASR
jgi:murein DD-endopeptidase MepM/ murein hydrolase activator NlpD